MDYPGLVQMLDEFQRTAQEAKDQLFDATIYVEEQGTGELFEEFVQLYDAFAFAIQDVDTFFRIAKKRAREMQRDQE